MAKLSAYGRVEVCTFTKTYTTPTLSKAVQKLRLMSDGVILAKFDGVFTDGMKMTGVWKKHAKLKDAKNVESFKAYAAKKGYTESND